VELGKATGTYLDPSHSRLTVGELGTTWLATQSHLKPSSIAVMESTWRLHVEPYWGRIQVGEVRHSDVQQWVHSLGSGLLTKGKPKSPTLVHRAHGILSSILEIAVRDQRISSNPARMVGLPRRQAKPHVYLTHEQV
jgi:hypothetical protein